MRAFALLFVAAFAGPARAQIPAPLADRAITRIEVLGEAAGATGARDIGIPLGARISRTLLRSTIERLLGSGRWADVQIDAAPDGDGVALYVLLRPRIVLTRIELIGNAVLDSDALLSAMGIARGGELEPEDLDRITGAARDLYAQRGYTDAQIEVHLQDTDDPSRKVMRVRIQEGAPLRVSGLRFEGSSPSAATGLPDSLGVGVGSVLDQRALGEGVRRSQEQLRDRGWLESRLGEPRVERGPGGAVVVVPLSLGLHYDVRLYGYQPLDRSAIEGVLHLHEERLTATTLDAMRDRVLDVLQRHGFHHAVVQVRRMRSRDADSAVLAVLMRPGSQLRVVGFSFPGATHFGSDYLHEQLASVLEEELPNTRLFAPVDSDTADRLGLSGHSMPARRTSAAPLEVDPGRVWYEPLYTEALEHLRELYEAAGYREARVGPPTLRETEHDRALVVIPVFEGPRTTLHAVYLDGNRLIGSRELLEAAQLSRGEPFSHLGLEEAIGRMTNLYRDRGYLYADIESAVRFSEDRERAEVALHVTERFPVMVGEITVEGVRHTDAGLVRDVMRLHTGDLFRVSLVRESQERLMALGIFTSVAIVARDADLPERVKPLIVRVAERLPQLHEELIGISTGQGLRASGEYGYRNLAGRGMSITARGQVGFQFLFQDPQLEHNITSLSLLDRLERRITVTFAVPQIAQLENVRATMDLIHIRDNERFFGLDKDSAVVSFIWQPIRRFQITAASELEFNGLRLFNATQDFESYRRMVTDPRLQRVLRVPAGNSAVFSARVLASLDERDSPFTPTRGFLASGSAEWVTTLATQSQGAGEAPFFSNFLKLGATFNGYIPFGDVIFAAQIRGGGIIHLEPGSQTYPNRQYFLGGVDTMRGFNQDQLLPQDLADQVLRANALAAMNHMPPPLTYNSVTRGGDLFILFRAELRIPIFESLQVGLFADIGNHWADPAAFDFLTLRPTAGLGLRIATPVGPVALDYGFNILRRAELNEPVGAFQFSIGVF